MTTADRKPRAPRPCAHATEAAPVCGACARNRARVAAWQAANRARLAARCRAWQDSHRKRRRAQRRAYDVRPENRARKATRERTRRAILRGAPADGAERIDLAAVYAYARGACALCGYDVPAPGEPCDPRARPTLDHRVPVSRGGSHVWGNVRLAHAGCNAARGAPDLAAVAAEDSDPIPF